MTVQNKSQTLLTTVRPDSPEQMQTLLTRNDQAPANETESIDYSQALQTITKLYTVEPDSTDCDYDLLT